MILIFKLILITSVWVLGLTIVTQPSMALHRLRVLAEKTEETIMEPLILCHWCMPSIHSLVGYAFAIGIGLIDQFRWSLVVSYPLVVMGASIICGLTWTLYQTMNALIEYLTEKTEYFKPNNDGR